MHCILLPGSNVEVEDGDEPLKARKNDMKSSLKLTDLCKAQRSN